MNASQKNPEDNKENLKSWMTKAKLIAVRDHNIVSNDDHEFWEAVRSYWRYEIDPGTAVKSVISYYF